jgi:hypothetical protein
MIFVKNTVVKNPTISSKLANGKTSISSPSYVFCPSRKYYSNVSADSGKICKIATLMKRAPANVEPKMRSLGLDLKAFDRMGRVPTKVTIPKNSTMKNTLSIPVIVYSSMIKVLVKFL